MVIGRTPEKLIAAIYQSLVVSPGRNAPAQIDVVNAKPGNGDVVVRFAESFGKAQVSIYNTQGKLISQSMQTIGAGAEVWEVPPSGLLQIRRVSSE
jgi:hypothetical protein